MDFAGSILIFEGSNGITAIGRLSISIDLWMLNIVLKIRFLLFNESNLTRPRYSGYFWKNASASS
jgi:hypothetical protein